MKQSEDHEPLQEGDRFQDDRRYVWAIRCVRRRDLCLEFCDPDPTGLLMWTEREGFGSQMHRIAG